MLVSVGRIGRAHGVRGEVAVLLGTDDPEVRFAPGAVLTVEAPGVSALTVVRTRWHSGRLLVVFDGVADRTRAEELRGTVLQADVDPAEVPSDPEEFYDHQLVGLRAQTSDGVDLGVVRDVVHLPGQDLLALTVPDRPEVLVPFVAAIVPEVDVAGGRVVVDPPAGLLELAEAPDGAG